MSFFKKLKEVIAPQPTTMNVTPLFTPSDKIKHEFVNFAGTYRIGILAEYSAPESQEVVNTYKKHLEKLGYDCEVLLFVDNPEKENTIYLQKFTPDDLDSRTGLPHSPRTDRFIVKRYDLLLNIYLSECQPLQYVSHMSYARCRVAPYLDSFTKCADLLIPMDSLLQLETLISNINNTLNLQPYERQKL